MRRIKSSLKFLYSTGTGKREKYPKDCLLVLNNRQRQERKVCVKKIPEFLLSLKSRNFRVPLRYVNPCFFWIYFSGIVAIKGFYADSMCYSNASFYAPLLHKWRVGIGWNGSPMHMDPRLSQQHQGSSPAKCLLIKTGSA